MYNNIINMMYEAIKNFNKQFEYEPIIENEEQFKKKNKFIIVGMGGSNLVSELLKIWKPETDILIHRDYGLPFNTKDRLLILSSYSGNTEEVIDAFGEGVQKNLPMAVITTGGKLLKLAQKHFIPYIQIPNTDIQPRTALGFSLKALLKFVGEEEALKEISSIAKILNPQDYENDGKILAKKLKNKIPIIYSSEHNMPIAYNWKIKFNETGKVPAFYNIFPELNHNEISGFDVREETKELSKNFYFLILKDEWDDTRILKRMSVLEQIYKNKGLSVDVIKIEGKDKYHKVFASLVLADWTAYNLAKEYGAEAEQVPIIEEFKKLLK